MTRQALVLAVAISLVAATPMLSRQPAPSEASLKAAHELLVQSVSTGNMALFGNVVHPRALGFFRDSQMLVQLRSGYTTSDVGPAVVADLSRFTATPTDTVFRVVGSVGIVCMTVNMQHIPWEKVQDRYLRGTYVYTLEDGNWKLLSWHSSDIPLVKK